MNTEHATRPHRNHNYMIDTLTLEDGRVRATARGRKRNVQTFAAGTTPEAAATELARKFEGERFAEVRDTFTKMGDTIAWSIWVRNV